MTAAGSPTAALAARPASTQDALGALYAYRRAHDPDVVANAFLGGGIHREVCPAVIDRVPEPGSRAAVLRQEMPGPTPRGPGVHTRGRPDHGRLDLARARVIGATSRTACERCRA